MCDRYIPQHTFSIFLLKIFLLMVDFCYKKWYDFISFFTAPVGQLVFAFVQSCFFKVIMPLIQKI